MPAPSGNSSAANGRRASRSGPSKAMVILKLSPKLLSRFANPNEKGKNNYSTPPKIKEPSPASSSPTPAARPSSVDNASDTASTPATGPAAADPSRRKSGQAAKAGTKRTFNQASETIARSRGRPGSRKKPKLEDGTSDHPKPAPTSHRLGPKANTGAINAQLRALDRSGAPCRKWERKPLQLKSFTGIQWQLPSWRAPKSQKVETNGEAKEATLETGDSDSKANNSISGVPSEKSHSGDGDITPVPQTMMGSPSPAVAMAA